ncbi:hypothetical protein [Xanthomonas albilineans]|uniref:Transmembrane protein n=1 Tax=Xanthomonas albilineans (strain GPE PC73 / CFBP 7063) TaxID=380358 RepID=D2UEL4_XANAP|nr:hypothetical protein [Xanthomonas albilineans]PPU91613.1 hypothetical protein XalbCFBP2523_14135 [Xanthomonas albilineans]QHQ28852.1 hypothetical protein XaFJ1_GM002125 [Xanthomonas albilineans]CBA16610.1 hypothetical protein XALC_2127 [Xanthomonas albilineans GPE PC73]
MSTSAEAIASAPNQDAEHLRMLGIGHYVVGGLTGIFALIPVLHLSIGLMMLNGRLPLPATNAAQAHLAVQAHLFAWIFVVIASLIIATGLSLAAAMLYAGRCLGARRRHTYCVIVAGLSCVMMPFGTVLGVFTLLVLTRPSVKQLFAQPA